MNATPLIATVAIAGAGAFWYYSKIHCPDPHMERVDGDCTCMEGYYADPNDDTKCVALTTTEAPENKAVLNAGVYVYSADGDAVDTSDESVDIVIDCLLCKAVEGSSRQAQDGRCLRCQPAATQQQYRDDDGALDHAAWITDYESTAEAATTPPNPISADYEWVFETTQTNEAETMAAGAGYSPYNYSPDLSTCVSDKLTRPSSVL